MLTLSDDHSTDVILLFDELCANVELYQALVTVTHSVSNHSQNLCYIEQKNDVELVRILLPFEVLFMVTSCLVRVDKRQCANYVLAYSSRNIKVA